MWFDSGRICLDLAATSAPREGLRDGDGLRLWLAGAGLVPDRTPLARVDPDWAAAFRALRGDVEALVRAELDGADPREPALSRVNALAAGPPRDSARCGTTKAGSYGSCAAASTAGRCSPPWPGTPSSC